MNGDFSELLQGVLKDPDTMQKLMGVAKNFLSDSGTETQTARGAEDAPASAKEASPSEAEEERESETPPKSPSPSLMRMTAGNGERIALILALRPYLSPARRQTADNLVKMLKMLKLADLNTLFRD